MEKNLNVRKIDELGRLVIPDAYRSALNWHSGTHISVILNEDGILLQAYNEGCIICGNENNLKTLKNKYLCINCIAELIKC